MTIHELLDDMTVSKYRRQWWTKGQFIYVKSPSGHFMVSINPTAEGSAYALTRDDVLADDWEPTT
jgi:hypothetical protein